MGVRKQNWKGRFGGICTILLLREQKHSKTLNLVKLFNKKKEHRIWNASKPQEIHVHTCIPFSEKQGKGSVSDSNHLQTEES